MSDAEHVDEADETIEAEAAEVLDPGDYNQNQRLKEIHQARRDVREALKETTSGKARKGEHMATHRKLAEAVTFYGHELLPLMDEAEWDHDLPDHYPWDTVRQFIATVGHSPDKDYPPKNASLHVFSRLNQFARQAGLGADLDDGTDEWEV